MAQRLAEFTAARARLQAAFTAAGVRYPPHRVVLLAIKRDKSLTVYAESAPDAGSARHPRRRVCAYPILAASGELGPKLREGDRQVPEGAYAIESLNPTSRFHVALRIAYPSPQDRRWAELDARTNLGGDIMIHGGAASVGCLAMGDSAAEELFILAAEVGLENVTAVITPVDLRRDPLPAELGGGWREDLYARLRAALADLPP